MRINNDQVAAFEYLYDNPEFRNTDSLLLAFYNQTQADNMVFLIVLTN